MRPSRSPAASSCESRKILGRCRCALAGQLFGLVPPKGRARSCHNLHPCRFTWASSAINAGRYTSSAHRPAFNSAGQPECIFSPAVFPAPKKESSEKNQCDRTVSRTMCLEEDTQRRASTKSFRRVEEEERRSPKGKYSSRRQKPGPFALFTRCKLFIVRRDNRRTRSWQTST